MDADLKKLVDFIELQKAKQAPRFPAIRFEKLLSFMGTTSLPGTHAALAICPIHGVEPTASPQELRIRLGGRPPRPASQGECLTVHLTNVDQYQGYQVKTLALGAAGEEASLCETRGDELVVHGSRIFTVHLSPYTMRFFEKVPYEEVRDMIAGVPFALVGLGETANISPRFVFHSEVNDGRLALYHGDGLALKTYANLRSNRLESRLVVDLDDFSGYVLRGAVEEFRPEQYPEAYERVCQGFTAGAWGKPSRTFRLAVEAWEPIAPMGPARKRS